MTMAMTTWTAADLDTSKAHVIQLAPTIAAALRRNAATAKRAVAQLDAVAFQIERRLGPTGPGFAITTGAELAECSDDELATLLTLVSARLGRLVGQNPENESVVVVSDSGATDTETARGYLNNAEMRLHTDPTDIAALLCLHASETGGANIYASCGAVLDAITDTAPDVLHEYFRLWSWDLRGLQRPGADRVVLTPLFSIYRGELSCRYGARMLRDGAANGSGVVPESDERLLTLFESAAHRTNLNLRHTLARGEIVWLNNYRVLHGREAFVDDAACSARILLRVWLWRHRAPSVAPVFRHFADAIDRHI